MSKQSFILQILCLTASLASGREDAYYIVAEGGTALMSCDFSSISRHGRESLKVVYNPSLNLSTPQDTVIWQFGYDYNRRRMSFNFNVLSLNISISDVQLDDAGRYSCSNIYSHTSAAFNLIVIENQNSTIYKRQVVRYGVIQGESLVLSCISFYPQNNNWKWYRGMDFDTFHFSLPIIECITTSQNECYNISSSREYIDSSTQSYSLLKFPHLDFESRGKYTCVDGLFTIQKSFEIIVVDSGPSEMWVDQTKVSDNEKIDFIRGQTSIIKCSMRYLANSSQEHYLNLIVTGAEYLNHTRDNGSLVYTYKTIVNEPKSHTCYIKLPTSFHFYKKPTNFTVHVNPLYCPEQLSITGNLSSDSIQNGSILNCIVSAVPFANVSWTSEKRHFPFTNGRNYASITVVEGGIYTCQAKSSCETALGHCQPLLDSISINHVKPSLHKKVKKMVRQGKPLHLGCKSYNLRNNNWKWFRNWNQSSQVNIPIVDCNMNEKKECTNNSSSIEYHHISNITFTQLILQNSRINDSGSFTCIDSLMTLQTTFDLAVMACPHNLVLSKINLENSVESKDLLFCSVTASPAVNVTWSVNGARSKSASGLNKAKIQVMENGTYTCGTDHYHHNFLGACGGLSASFVVQEPSSDFKEYEDY